MTALTSPGRPRSRAAYTLVEMLIAMAVFGLVMAGVLSFFLQGLDMFHFDVGKLRVNRDIRAFTSELSDNATYSNYFRIYRSFTDRAVAQLDGRSGDFLVLAYVDPDDTERIERLVGYYRAPDATGEGPVRKFDLSFSPSTSANLADLLPSAGQIDAFDQVVELSRGLADGRLFYNYRDRSIMIKGEIIHSGTVTRRATNTYNFTVTPRG